MRFGIRDLRSWTAVVSELLTAMACFLAPASLLALLWMLGVVR